jgi:hypothetical protein
MDIPAKLAAVSRRVRRQVERRYVDPQRLLIGESAMATRRASSVQLRDLWDAEIRVFSQFGEDGILDFLCDALGLSKPRILEIGAGDFSECNSRFLVESRGASAVVVDGEPGLVDFLSRGSLVWRASVWGREVWVTPDNIKAIAEDAHALMGGLDIFSLDVDGIDYWILQKLPLTGVSIVVVEYNPAFGALRSITVPRDDAFDRAKAHVSWLYYGASLRAFVDLLSDRGFTFVGSNRAGNNAFFVDSRRIEDLRPSMPQLPDADDLQRYVDWRVRDSRDGSGAITGDSLRVAMNRIAGLPVVNTRSMAREAL